MPNSLLVGWETVHRLMGSLASFWERVYGLLGPPGSFMPLRLVQCVAEDQRTSGWRLSRKYMSHCFPATLKSFRITRKTTHV